MSRRKRFQPNIKKNSTFFLNINSLTDMFTIMLVFLLQTYSTADVEVSPVAGLRLPASNTSLNPVEGARVTVSKDELRMGDHVLTSLKDKQFAAKDTDVNDPNFLPVLFAELDKLAKDEATKDKEWVKQGRVLLQADVAVPYQTLKKVMYTASMAGFPQLKLVTMVGN